MFVHCIYTAACYRLKKHVAIDKVFEFPFSEERLDQFRKSVIGMNKTNIPLSFHMKMMDSNKISDLKKKDLFFKEFDFKESIDEFYTDVLLDAEISSVDVGKYILAKKDYSLLPLQKMVYFCHAEYLFQTGRPLFTDTVFAFDKGPVEESLWEKYHHQGTGLLKEKTFGADVDRAELIMKGRLRNARDGLKKLEVIDRTFEALKHKSTRELVELTHSSGSPWARAYQKGAYRKEISDEAIQKFHEAERPRELSADRVQ